MCFNITLLYFIRQNIQSILSRFLQKYRILNIGGLWENSDRWLLNLTFWIIQFQMWCDESHLNKLFLTSQNKDLL